MSTNNSILTDDLVVSSDSLSHVTNNSILTDDLVVSSDSLSNETNNVLVLQLPIAGPEPLLIRKHSYYNDDKPFLLLLTHKAKAKFKVGFSTVEKRLNHLLINIDFANYKGFTNELFRYLKILNKI